MSSLLNSLRSRQSDDHGVAELLEAVSQRSMSCTEEERKELDSMVKRVREHKPKPNPVEMIQKKLSVINIGGNNNNSHHNENNGTMSSPVTMSKIRPSLQNLGSPLNEWRKDLLRSFSKIQNPLSQESPSHSSERVDQDLERSGHVKGPGLLRDFGPTPTIVVLPPEEPGPSTKKDERQQDDSSSEESEQEEHLESNEDPVDETNVLPKDDVENDNEGGVEEDGESVLDQ
mmetsp:Transcript_28660/g.47720  ORF Transcript_28660/g.47720 Transcript_28660/m.47720 type:complete len:230 (-) Transcript_28660:471-1160(-)